MVKPLPNPPKPLHGRIKATVPLDMLVNKIVNDLFMVFAGNGYRNVGFALLVQNLEEDGDGEQPLAMGGNLQPEAMTTILTNAHALVKAAEDDAPRIIVQ